MDSSYDFERSQPLLILFSVLLGLALALIGDVGALAGHLITPLLMDQRGHLARNLQLRLKVSHGEAFGSYCFLDDLRRKATIPLSLSRVQVV